MKNPWVNLPNRPPFVLQDDRPYIEAWNKTRTRKAMSATRLRLDLLPEPFLGPRNAPLVVLGRNPGFAGTEEREHARRNVAKALRSNYLDDPTRHFNCYLGDPAFEHTAGGKWARRAYGAIIRPGDISFEHLATRILTVEWHGYHSRNWAALPITLPSQHYGFHLVQRAVDRGAVIVVLRGYKDWCVAVPPLASYKYCYKTKNARSASLSPKNLPPGAFQQVLRAVSGS